MDLGREFAGELVAAVIEVEGDDAAYNGEADTGDLSFCPFSKAEAASKVNHVLASLVRAPWQGGLSRTPLVLRTSLWGSHATGGSTASNGAAASVSKSVSWVTLPRFVHRLRTASRPPWAGLVPVVVPVALACSLDAH